MDLSILSPGVERKDVDTPWFGRLAPFDAMMAGGTALLACGDVLLARAVHLVGVGHQVAASIGGGLLLSGLFYFCRWVQEPRLVEATRTAVRAWFIITLIGPSAHIIARCHTPLQDAALAAFDARLHLSTEMAVRFICKLPALQMGFAVAYWLLTPLAIAALFVPDLCGQGRRSSRFVLSVIIASSLTMCLFYFCPAIGPWTVERIAAAPQQAHIESYLRALKSSAPVSMNLKLGAIVAFPSFHVVLCLLACIALWGIRWLRPITLLLTIAICISTLTTGWHYTVDVLGGFLVALVAHLIATGIVNKMPPEKPSRLSS